MAKLHLSLRPYNPNSDDPFDAAKAAHLLNRAGFGGTRDEIEKVLKLGPVEAVDWLLDFPEAGAEEQSQDDLPDLSSIEGYPKNFREIQQKVRGMTPDERMKYRQMLNRANREAVNQTVYWWMNRMAYGAHPLQEKLSLFWHGHFTTSAKDERAALLMWNQNELLRRQSAGNFREFVRQISRDPAMLSYLNNQQNRKKKPNENYARELMELFTLGIGNYSERDIKEAARAFTGWGHDGEDFVFRKNDHDDDEKSFFSRRGNFDGDDIVDIILQHPASAKYLATKLFRWFAFEDVAQTVAENLALILRQSKWDMRPLLRTILTSQAFYSQAAIGTQVKSPVQLVVGTIRMLGLDMPQARTLAGPLTQMGQMLLEPPNVKGWPGGRAWINTSTLFVRYNTAMVLANGAKPQASAASDPAAVVDDWLSRLIQRPVSDDKKNVLREALAREPQDEQNVKKMVQLIVSMPEYQLC